MATTLIMEQSTIETIVKSAEALGNVSREGVVYFPFETEKETVDWIEDVISEWWDDETV